MDGIDIAPRPAVFRRHRPPAIFPRPARRRAMHPRILAVACLVLAATAAAGDAPVFVRDAFDPSQGKTPEAGEWVEYLIAFPVDPLENSLAPNPLPPLFPGSGQDDREGAAPSPFRPTFEPPEAWLALPLRLEVIRAEEDGLRVNLTFEGARRDVFLPLRAPEGEIPFRYESPQPEEEEGVHQVGDARFPVTVTRRQDPRGGFVRLSGRDFPFGLARFATENVDISFVAMGEGAPPAFPLPESGSVSPPPGLLYRSE